MEVILLERVAKLGQMGEVVRVRDGFARNFLLPQGKALRATQENKAKFESMKTQLQAQNLATKAEADKIGTKLDGKSFAVIRQASDTGQLYGSVSPRDLATILTDNGYTVNRSQIALSFPIKMIGQHKVPVQLHPELEVAITINVARSADEAERLARGEDITARREEGAEDQAAEAEAAAQDLFEPASAEDSSEAEVQAETPAKEEGKRAPRSKAKAKATAD